uniref:Uncharacterized protein n=1 Tax=Arundo donax TaxID=35708 RepID=A0A0A9RBB0_ARUDO
MLGIAPSKTHRLRCFQIVQAPDTIRELSPFRINPVVAAFALSHQASKDDSPGCGARQRRPTCRKMWNQICLENTQETRRWSILSSS